MNKQKIIMGADHAGFAIKEDLKKHLARKGVEVEDVGTHSEESADHPVFAKAVANKVLKDPQNKGILICGTGIGMSITANKIKGIRAALATTPLMAQVAREHNDANILCLGGRVLKDSAEAIMLVDIFLNSRFMTEVERYKRRVDMYES